MRLIWSESALDDLQRIDDWLTGNAGGEVAEAQLERIKLRVRRLRDFPRTGAMLPDGVRDVPVPGTNYVVIYQVDERVEILRIRHNREDWRPQG